MRFKRLWAVLVMAVTFLVPAAMASPIGTVDISGLGVVRVSLDTIDWGPLGGDDGDVFVVNGSDDYNVVVGTTGLITDLSFVTAMPGPPLATPVDPFLQLPGVDTRFVFNLEQIIAGTGPSCAVLPGVGSSCTPTNLVPNSPFTLTQNATSVSVSMEVRGMVTDLVEGGTLPYYGLFTANLTQPNQNTVAEILTALGPQGPGFVESSWSAQLTAIPEPSSMTFALSGLALVGLSAALRRLKR